MTLPSFRIAVRRLTRQKLGTTLHVMGLTLGLSVCLLIGLYLHHELSYDTYHTHAERIYRVNQTWIFSGERHDHFSTPVPLADAIRDEFPEFEAVSHVHPDYDALIEVGPKRKFIQDHVLFADADFLNLFDVHMIEGNGFTVLNTPNQVILTRSVAEKFYGKEDPIGKTFKLKDKLDLTVGGVAEDFPANTHLPASMLISFSSLTSEYYGAPLTQWGMVSGGETLVMLPPGEDAAGLQPRLQSIYDRNLNNDPNLPAGETCELSLQPLLKVHFEEQYRGGGEWVKAINPKWLWFLAPSDWVFWRWPALILLISVRHKLYNAAKKLGSGNRWAPVKVNCCWPFYRKRCCCPDYREFWPIYWYSLACLRSTV